MARHAAPTPPRHTLLRAGLALTAAGAALGLGGTAAQAADAGTDAGAGVQQALGSASQALGTGVGHGLQGAVSPVTHLQLDPLANTGVDPLDNGVGTQIADFKPVSTTMLTDPVTKGGALSTLPVTGQLTSLLGG